MKELILIAVVISLSACATPGTPTSARGSASAADRAAVITAVQSLFDAMRTRDTTAIRALFAPNTNLVSIRSEPGTPSRFQAQPLSTFIIAIGAAREELVERMWDPRVDVDGDMASLWAPYDFRIGSTFSHCGHDALHLVRTGEGWKVVAITYTVQRTGCSTP